MRSQQVRKHIYNRQRSRMRASARSGMPIDAVPNDAVIEKAVLASVHAKANAIYESPYDGRLVAGSGPLPPAAFRGIRRSRVRLEVKTFKGSVKQVELNPSRFDLLLLATWRIIGRKLVVDCWYLPAEVLRRRRSITNRYRIGGSLGAANRLLTDYRVRF